MSKDAPLPTVGMAGQDQVYGIGDERKILRMVREQDMIASLTGESGKPPCLWLMIPGMNCAADAANALLAWVAVGTAEFGSKGAVVCNVAGGQTGDDNLLVSNCDRLPLIIQHRHTSGGEEIKIRLIHHPLVIAEGHGGRRDGSAGTKEGQDV